MSEKTGIYVFCAVQSTLTQSLGTITFEGKERSLYSIPYKDVSMIAAEVPMKIYHPNKENLHMHQQVLASVMAQSDAVVPISFGNLFQTEQDAVALLESLYPQLSEIFPQIKGKIEVGLKVVGKKEWLEKKIHEQETVRKKKQVVQSKSKAAGYFDRIQLGEMAKNFFNALQQEMEADIHTPLTGLAVANKLNEPIGEKMLLNAAYLIKRDQEARFDEKVNELYEKWQDQLDFKYTGPWPAYNFINIKLQIEANTS